MTEQQRRFADKYFETLNGSESAIYAGYSEKTARQQAYNMLQEDDIQAYLTDLKAEYSRKSGITKEWVMSRFKEISDDAYGNADYSGANKATEMLGKIIGVFEKDNEQSKTAATVTIFQLPDNGRG